MEDGQGHKEKMKLAFSIPNKLWWIHNFLDRDTYKGIHNAIIKQRDKINLKPVTGSWSKKLTMGLKDPERVEVSNYPPFEKLKTLLQRNPFVSLEDVTRITTAIHFMKKDTGINWHNDDKWKYGATYYLNNRWHKRWGGEFMFTDDYNHGWIPPLGNSLVIVKAPLDHKVNTILSPIIPRISTQIFMK